MTIAVLDQGSSSTKGALISAQGKLLDRVRIRIGTTREGNRVEHDPEEIVGSLEAALVKLGETAPIQRLAISCQRSTCLLWDRATGKALTAALSWQDLRAARDLETWTEEERQRIRERTGLRLSAHYAGPKLAWLLERVPGARPRAEAGEILAGTLDAFLARRLTGEEGTEPGHAGRTLLYDLAGDVWDPWLRERFGIPEAALPPLGPSLRPWGRWERASLEAVLGDQQAALVGHGELEAGVVAVHFGTGAFVLAATGERPRRHPGLLTAVVWSDGETRHFQLEGAVNSAGRALDWMAERTGFDLAGWSPERFDLDTLPRCVPAFSGLGSPWWDPTARAVFLGLRNDHGPEELVSAVAAGVVFRIAENLEAMRESGLEVREVRISGPMTRLPALGRLLADLSGSPTLRMAEEEAGLVGLARLLGLDLEPGVAGVFEPEWSPGRRSEALAEWRRAVALTTAPLFSPTPP